MNSKKITDFLCLSALVIWPICLIVSLMALSAPSMGGELKVISITLLVLTYPIFIFLGYFLLRKDFLGFEGKTVFLYSVLAYFLATGFLGHLNYFYNAYNGIKNSGYSVADGKVYYSGTHVLNADSKSFEVLELENKSAFGDDYSKDKNSVYYHDKKIERASTETFRLLERNARPHATDGSLNFYLGKIVDEN